MPYLRFLVMAVVPLATGLVIALALVAAKAVGQDQAQSLAGTQIGSYQILSLIGKGGMGEVYLARDTRLGRKIGLKLLPSEFSQDQSRVRRLEREARAASTLNHPNIVTIHEIGEFEGTTFIATEFIEGQTPASKWPKNG